MNNEDIHPAISNDEIDMFFNNSNLKKHGDHQYFLKPSPRIGDVLIGIKLGYKDHAGNYTITIEQQHYNEPALAQISEYPTPRGYTNRCSIWDFHPSYEQIMNHLIAKKMEQ